jgi:class 3 adenylate cyclase
MSLSDRLQGRADYHGTSVNLAARMLAVAAAGGSIVTSCELAQAVFRCERAHTDAANAVHPSDSCALNCQLCFNITICLCLAITLAQHMGI